GVMEPRQCRSDRSVCAVPGDGGGWHRLCRDVQSRCVSLPGWWEDLAGSQCRPEAPRDQNVAYCGWRDLRRDGRWRLSPVRNRQPVDGGYQRTRGDACAYPGEGG